MRSGVVLTAAFCLGWAFSSTAFADVDALNLKKGDLVLVSKPAKISQYTWSPTGGGISEPDFRSVEVQPGQTFTVKSVSVRDWSTPSYVFWSDKHRSVTVILDAKDSSNDEGIGNTFQIQIGADPLATQVKLDYLNIFIKKIDPTWAKAKDGSVLGNLWQVDAVRACCEMSGGTNCLMYPRDRKNKIQLASARDLAKIAVEHGAKIIEVNEVAAAPEGFELIQGIDYQTGDDVAFYYSAEKYQPENDQFSQQWNFTSTTYVKGNTSHVGVFLALDGVTGQLTGLAKTPSPNLSALHCVLRSN